MPKTPHGPRRGYGRDYTTGDLSALFRVAPRTVSKWCDRGALPCFRLPGSKDRRVYHEDVVAFAIAHNLRVPDLLSEAVSIWLETPIAGVKPVKEFELGLKLGRRELHGLVIGTTWGLAAAGELHAAAAQALPGLSVVLFLDATHDVTSFVRGYGGYTLVTQDAAAALDAARPEWVRRLAAVGKKAG